MLTLDRRFRLLLSLFIIVSIASVSVGYVWGQSVLSFTTVIQNGSMITEASYIIFRDDSTYYARNGRTGAISLSSTNSSYVVNEIMDTLLALGEVGGSITIIGSPEPIAFVLGYVANNTHLEGIGEVQITSPNTGASEFIMRESATLTNIYIKHNGEPIHYYYQWSPELALMHDWTNFPSNGGILTGIPYMIWDGIINTEGVGEIITPFLRFYPSESNPDNVTFAIRPSIYGELLFYNLATGNPYHVYGQVNITGAVNQVTVTYPHSYTLAGNANEIISISITPQQLGQGLYWASSWTNTTLTIGFENAPGASTWYFFYEVYMGIA